MLCSAKACSGQVTMRDDNHLIWIDLEMTGLNPARDVIIEIATLITNPQLDILAEGPVIAIHQVEAILDGMDEWNTKQHNQSGLCDRVRQSQYDTATAEKLTIEFLQGWVPEGKSPMCGNTICQDRRFLANYMPGLEKYFHYRNLDVSSIKILAQHWQPDIAASVKKSGNHLAMDDIKDSVAELLHYREHFFKL